MIITTKFDLGQEVFFLDSTCAGCTPGKGKVIGISFEQKETGEQKLLYKVKCKGLQDVETFYEFWLYASISEFKEAMIQLIYESCKDYEEEKV